MSNVAAGRRFIDWSEHGGCSRKIDGVLLGSIISELELTQPWADAATIDVGSARMAATLDIVLPMIDSPSIFGEIVVAHVLSDLYAVGARPVAALNILGVPDGLPVTDDAVKAMLTAGANVLSTAGAVLLGGHSIENDQLLYGLSAIGQLDRRAISHAGATVGDHIVISKPLGTSIATTSWKRDVAALTEFEDVVAGMRRLNAKAGELLGDAAASACTDVTGFGFAGHLHNLLRASGCSGVIDLSALPLYPSTTQRSSGAEGTRLLDVNEDFVLGYVAGADNISACGMRQFVFDAQVSGGLIATVPDATVHDLLERAGESAQEMWRVGRIVDGRPGAIEFVTAAPDARK